MGNKDQEALRILGLPPDVLVLKRLSGNKKRVLNLAKRAILRPKRIAKIVNIHFNSEYYNLLSDFTLLIPITPKNGTKVSIHMINNSAL